MSGHLKPGVRVASPACTAEFIVVRAPVDPVDLCWVVVDGPGGLLGKRYVDADDTFELLCVSAGPSLPAVGNAVLVIKNAKPLPSSD